MHNHGVSGIVGGLLEFFWRPLGIPDECGSYVDLIWLLGLSAGVKALI